MAKEETEDEKSKKDAGEDLTIVTDDPKNLDAQAGDEEEAKDSEEEKDSEEQSEEEEDERLGASEEREREKEEKEQRPSHKTRRQRRREAQQRLEAQLRFYEARNEQLEKALMVIARRQDQQEVSSIDNQIAQSKSVIAKAEKVIAEANSAGKGDEAVEAMRIRDNARDRLKTLETQKTRATEEREEAPPEHRPDPRAVAKARSWQRQNPWFDPQWKDQDSRIVRAIDDSLAEEGFDPASDEYWKELNKRIAETLPRRARKAKANGHDEDEDDDEEQEEERRERRSTPKPKRAAAGTGGPKFRTAGPGRELGPNEVFLSRERIEAMKEAGVWDDPVARKKMLKRYRDFDRENNNR